MRQASSGTGSRYSSRSRLTRVLAIVAQNVLVLISCASDTTAPPLPPDAREFTPEAVYRDWWAQVEQCSGRTAVFDDVRWYVVPGEDPFRVDGVAYPVLGYWERQGNRIVLLQYVPDSRAALIRHEALHAILRRTDHPAEFFVERCGEVITSQDWPGTT